MAESQPVEQTPDDDNLEQGETPQPVEQDTEQHDEPVDDDIDGQFDPKRALRTIKRLRQEVKDAKKGQIGEAELRRENLQLRVAHKLKLPIALATRLQGDDEAAMVEDASALLAELGVTDEEDAKPPVRQPRPKLAGGSRPSQEPDITPADLVAQAIGRK